MFMNVTNISGPEKLQFKIKEQDLFSLQYTEEKKKEWERVRLLLNKLMKASSSFPPSHIL